MTTLFKMLYHNLRGETKENTVTTIRNDRKIVNDKLGKV